MLHAAQMSASLAPARAALRSAHGRLAAHGRVLTAPAQHQAACQLRTASAASLFVARRTLLGMGIASAGAVAGGGRAMAAAGGSLPPPPDVAKPPANAQFTASGLASLVVKPGTGSEHPGPADKVTVDYSGWTAEGKMFDSSVTRGQNITFGLNQVIAGWTEGLQLMTAGETRRLWIPANLAYGERPPPGAPAGQLCFDVTLYSFKSSPKPPSVPADVAAVPADAVVTSSGLASRMLKAGSGGAKPKATDRVTVNYSGWTTNGKLFDSSIPTGEPVTFPLNQVIKGWTEGLQLMEPGESRRFWIPAELAYGTNPRPGAPAGMLVFDVDLLSVAK